MKKLNRFDVELKARKVGSEKRLYFTSRLNSCVCRICVKMRARMPKGEKKPRTPKTEGLSAAACESAKRHQKRLMTLFFLSFFSLGKVPAQTGRPLVDPESPRASIC